MAYNYGNYQNYQVGQQQPYPPTFYPGNYQTATPIPYTGQNYQTAAPMNQPQQQSNNAGFVWVQGEAAAKAYPVAPGNSVLLMDSDAPVLYMKSTDTTGKPLPLEVYDLVKRETAAAKTPTQVSDQAPQTQVDLSGYVKETELEEKVKELVNKYLEQ